MKFKSLFVIFLSLFSYATHAEIKGMVRSNPVFFLVGGVNLEGNISLVEKLSLGLGMTDWSAEVSDVDLTLREQHIRLDYWFSGTFQDGWYANLGYSTLAIDLKTEDSFGKEYKGDVSGSAITMGGGYHFQWENFCLDLGLQVANYGFDSQLELEASDGDTEKESLPTGSNVGLDFQIGWVF